MFLSTVIGIVFSIVIILVWGYIGVLTFALYSTTLVNHHQMRMFYTIAVLNILQAILGIYFIGTGDSTWQQSRWVAFSLIDIAYLSFVIVAFKKRWFELVLRTMFYILVLITFTHYNLFLNLAICGVLVWLSAFNKEEIIRKYFTWIFASYSLTTIVPTLFGFTTNISLFMGVLYTIFFAYGAKKLYDKEKVNDAVDAQIKMEVSNELGVKIE